MTTAAQQARHRAARRARGQRAPSGKSGKGGKHKSQFDAGVFVAIDGEGFSIGEPMRYVVGEHERVYTAREHHYALLSASDGTELYAPTGRLQTKQCLDFLLAIKASNPRAILVCFGASYDMCHMLAFGLSRASLFTLLHGDDPDNPLARKYLDVTLQDGDGKHDYRLELRPRKSLSIWRWEPGADKYEEHIKRDGSVTWKMAPCHKCVLWDVWGFFQGTFVDAMKNWLPEDADAEFIRTMKGDRSEFDRTEIETIRRYNAAELRCLVAIMDRVRDAVRSVGLSITRWDGAGSIAGAMMKLHDVQSHMAVSPTEVFEACRIAYSGGHIEACKIGFSGEIVHHYDVNSAYPAQFTHLPSLARGSWTLHDADAIARHGMPRLDMDSFVLVHVEYRFRPGLPFYPLFYRTVSGAILYPERGAGWYWGPEYVAAREFVTRFGAIEFRVLEYWQFASQSNARPFQFIDAYYQQRVDMIAETRRTGIPNGAEKTLKLGCNSCAGKTAQQVGARIEGDTVVPPAYFQLEWAGYVTAGCRAQLMLAAIQKPHAIIAFATDGLFTTEALDLECPAEKKLGAWEYKTHTGITMVMPGVYWLHDDEKVQHYSRGFDKKVMNDFSFVHQAWARKQAAIEVPSRRMVTLGTALMSDSFWNMRGLFVETVRELKLNGGNSKRYPVSMHRSTLHKGLHTTSPQDIPEDFDMALTHLCSEPYDLIWLKDEDMPEEPGVADRTDADRSFAFDAEALVLV